MLKSTLQQTDPEIYNIIQKEAERQEYGIELIASENYTSKAVMEAMGSVLTNKYSEGYVGKRYYGGNEVIDEMEALAIDRCKKLFGCDHVNIQPLSGSPANAAVYFAVLIRFSGQRCRVLRRPQTGRQGPRPQARPRWTPFSRPSGELLRHALQLRAVRSR